jgi:hypothetical protein
MATTKKQNKTSDTEEGTGKIKRLKLNKQTVRDLSAVESSKVKGGFSYPCPSKDTAMVCTTGAPK